MTKHRQIPRHFSVAPLLLDEEDIPAEARQALLEERRQDAAEMLMQEYGLSSVEAGDLLDVFACKQSASPAHPAEPGKIRGSAPLRKEKS